MGKAFTIVLAMTLLLGPLVTVPAATSDPAMPDAAAVLSPVLLRNVQTSQELLAIVQEGENDLATAARLANAASLHQARTLGFDPSVSPPSPVAHATPNEAARALLDVHDVVPTDGQAAALQALDDLPEPTRSALRDVIDAFLGFQAATHSAYADVDVPRVRDLMEAGIGPQGPLPLEWDETARRAWHRPYAHLPRTERPPRRRGRAL